MENRNRLFIASALSLFVTAVAFGIRSNLLATWVKFGIDPVDAGWIFSAYLWGITPSVLLFGLLVETWGTARVIVVLFTTLLAGILLTVLATGFWSMFVATLLIGISNGCINAACNPLVTNLYPEEKTSKLNLFHMWYAIGVAVGCLMVFSLSQFGIEWRVQMALLLIPTLLCGVLFFGQKFPATERTLRGGSYKDMLKAIVSPIFLFLAFLMILTSSTEFGVNQWIPTLLKSAVADLFGDSAFGSALVLVWVSLVIAFARLIAAPIVRKLSSLGVLLVSTILAGVGVYMMSLLSGWSVFIAATIVAFGIAYFWPNILGLVADRKPMSGALGLAIIGGVGTLGGAIIQPIIAGIFSHELKLHGGEFAPGAVLTAAEEVAKTAAEATASSVTMRWFIVIPAFLVVAFTIMLIQQQRGKVSK